LQRFKAVIDFLKNKLDLRYYMHLGFKNRCGVLSAFLTELKKCVLHENSSINALSIFATG
jgi:hypothetical protein